MDALTAGFLLGVGVAAGLGPISLLCVTSGIRNGAAPALGVGLGAALVDGLYALAAGLGVAALIAGRTEAVFQIVGGVALLVIATVLARTRGSIGGRAMTSFGGGLRVSFAATLANPSTIVYWAGAFAATVPSLGLTRIETAAVLPAGVAIGSLAWFTLLAIASATLGSRIGDEVLSTVALVGALGIGVYGCWSLVEGVTAL
jgi:threonine/homoserine/homoserine lactone efflux protein